MRRAARRCCLCPVFCALFFCFLIYILCDFFSLFLFLIIYKTLTHTVCEREAGSYIGNFACAHVVSTAERGGGAFLFSGFSHPFLRSPASGFFL